MDKIVKKDEVKSAEVAEEEELPFPNARVVSLIRTKTGKAVIKKSVKVAMNRLLGDICLRISERMAAMPYATLSKEEFVKAAKPYIKLGLSQQERKKIVATLNKISEDAKLLSMEVGEEFKED